MLRPGTNPKIMFAFAFNSVAFYKTRWCLGRVCMMVGAKVSVRRSAGPWLMVMDASRRRWPPNIGVVPSRALMVHVARSGRLLGGRSAIRVPGRSLFEHRGDIQATGNCSWVRADRASMVTTIVIRVSSVLQ
jgi:hypothetical protein